MQDSDSSSVLLVRFECDLWSLTSRTHPHFALGLTHRGNFLAFSIVVFADIGSIFSAEGKTDVRKFSKEVSLILSARINTKEN